MALAPFQMSPDLTAIAVMYVNEKMIADKVAPRVPVNTEQFSYLKYPIDEAFTAPETRVGRRSAPNQVDFSSIRVDSSTEDHGLDAPVPNKDIMAWQKARTAGLTRAVDPKARATKAVVELVDLKREQRVASMVTSLANYGTANKTTLSGPSQWSDYTNSNPQTSILGAMDGMLMRPNVMGMGRAVWTALSQHPKICKATFGNNTDAGVVKRQQVADLLELDEIIVGEGWVNIAAKGQPVNIQRIWGKSAFMFNRNAHADTEFGITFALTAQWGGRVAGTIDDPDIGLHGGVRVRSGEHVKEFITANDLGYLWDAAVA